MPDGAVTGTIAVRGGAIVVREIGFDAARALTGGGTGRVAAVFARAIYLRTPRGWACAGPPGLGGGPLNLLCDLPDAMDWAARGLRPGAAISIGEKAIDLGRGLVLALDGARVWQPAPSGPWSQESLGKGLRALDRLTAGALPTAGLATFLRPDAVAASAEARKAAPNVAILYAWLRGTPESNASPSHSVLEAATRLLGLGPGLTPSGDDFLVGMLVVLSLAGRFDLVAAVDQVIRPTLEEGTGPISRLHLAAALDGESSERLHVMVNAVLAGDHDVLASRLVLISQVGHCSGWDTLAGAVMVLRVLARTASLGDGGRARCRLRISTM